MITTLALLAACDGTDPTTTDSDSAAPAELPIELGDCAEGTTLGWADVETIFADACTSCHSTALEGEARNGATEFFDYDTAEAAIASNSFLTWSVIYSGQMPKNEGPLPDDQRWLLWEWLSCGGPE